MLWEPHLEVSKVLLGLLDMASEADKWVPSQKYALPLTPGKSYGIISIYTRIVLYCQVQLLSLPVLPSIVIIIASIVNSYLLSLPVLPILAIFIASVAKSSC